MRDGYYSKRVCIYTPRNEVHFVTCIKRYNSSRVQTLSAQFSLVFIFTLYKNKVFINNRASSNENNTEQLHETSYKNGGPTKQKEQIAFMYVDPKINNKQTNKIT